MKRLSLAQVPVPVWGGPKARHVGSALLVIISSLSGGSCTETPSGALRITSDGKDLAARKEELGRFVRIRSEPLGITYTGWLRDNSSGLVPGPSDWEVTGWIRVVPEDLQGWARGLSAPDELPSARALADVLAELDVSSDDLRWLQGSGAVFGFASDLIVFHASSR